MNIEVAKLILSICALVVSVLTLCGFGVYMSLHTKKRFEKKQKEEEEAEALKEQARTMALMQLINDSLDSKLTPIQKDLESIRDNLALNTEGTVTILRNDMKKSLEVSKEKGFATATDKANWTELYNTYTKLGGNHFKEYVDAWRDEMKDLPPKKKTRQKLDEKK